MALCSATIDNTFGPRVDVQCREFDFTLLFEDISFIALPSVIFLVTSPIRLWALWGLPLEVRSRKIAITKLNLGFKLGTWLIPSSVLATAALSSAALQSYFEDQRSIRPSDLLVLYFSFRAILYIPTLRSLWQIDVTLAPRLTWTLLFINNAALAFLESARKRNLIRPPGPNATKEQTAGFWSRGFLSWVLPFLKIGNSQILDLPAIPKVDRDLQAISNWTEINKKWRQSSSSRYRLLIATLSASRWTIILAVPPRLALSTFRFCLPFLIESAVTYLNSTAEELRGQYYGYGLIGACGLVFLGIGLSRALYSRQTNRLMSKVRASLIATIYHHTTTLRACDAKDSAAVTLMGTDVERIVEALRLFHELWAAVPEVGIAVWLLARQISWACVAPLLVCLVHFGPAQKLWVEKVQDRVAVTASMLSDMKVVKMLGLTIAMENLVDKLRKAELHASEKFRRLLVWQILLGNGPEMIAPFVTFAMYAVIAVVSKDQTLLSSQALAALSLLGLMTAPLIAFCQALPAVPQAAACFGRIQEFCLKSIPPSSPSSHAPPSRDEASVSAVPLRTLIVTRSLKKKLFSFHHADISWPPNDTPVIQDLSLTISAGFTAIIGSVASGKSTLLASLIGETTIQSGTTTPCLSPAAFCFQTPWIMDDTLRHNITGGSEFDQKWYDFSVFSCCLDKDITTMPMGDITLAGPNGSSLSGGQRQRLTLARAVYSRLPVVVLDDTLSGLDPTTTGTILSRLFSNRGHFRAAGISLVIATHNKNILHYMDTVIILGEGRLRYSGKPEDITDQELGLDVSKQAIFSTHSGDIQDTNREGQPLNIPAINSLVSDVLDPARGQAPRQEGSWAVYGYYCRSARPCHIVLWIRYYLRTSRQVRLIDIEAKAPLYKHFIETVTGVATIRTFGWESTFLRRNQEMLDQSQAPYYMLLCIQQWLALVLDLIVGGIAVTLVAIAMTSNGAISGGSLGVALVLVLNFNINLAGTIQSWTALETSVGAVARVRDFVKHTPSETTTHSDGPPPGVNWPSKGGIEFQGVEARYSYKIVIAGSTGSGKTSIIMSLLKLVDVTAGEITIDGVDLAGYLPSAVAARLNVVPQEPFFLPGSVRYNFNPTGELPDQDIEAAIRKVGLWEKLQGVQGLDTELVLSEWSHGERQLLCLARALMSPSRILILDEATSR
ncbi:P-loop containing nucleoside triphosphate hydrolase protein [Apiosordaria backusii]|uniref:P-loop containing nucleoside triphosphate hydrolase protein n=1 Tax=Apiosordaria backusii TaxID=314023 RepID=A0AA40A750_9PEZI|nr:P-loop containing nucleoside triphosphate hydrolase protein [Apiosordaria backusii]